jgi:ATPase subunit of ABC transporter with duplicated ATPase domains
MSRLAAVNVSVSFGSITVLDGVSLSIGPSDRVGIVAPNGVGKSTLLKVLAGELEPDSGTVTRSPASTTVLRLAQEPDIRPGESLADHLSRRTQVAASQADLDASLSALSRGDAGADDAYDAALHRWLALGGADLPERMAQVTAELGLPDNLLDRNAAELSGGQQARLGLAAVLLAQPDILLLDEPTNDLDDAGLALLEARLRASRAGLALVSHDRALLAALTSQILELDEFSRHGSVFAGGWDAYVTERELARRRAADAYGAYEAERDKLTDAARRRGPALSVRPVRGSTSPSQISSSGLITSRARRAPAAEPPRSTRPLAGSMPTRRKRSGSRGSFSCRSARPGGPVPWPCR